MSAMFLWPGRLLAVAVGLLLLLLPSAVWSLQVAGEVGPGGVLLSVSSSARCNCRLKSSLSASSGSGRGGPCRQPPRYYPPHLTTAEPNMDYQGPPRRCNCNNGDDALPPCVPILPMPTAIDTERQLRQAVNDAVDDVARRRKWLEERVAARDQQARYVTALSSAPFGPPFPAAPMEPTGIPVPPAAVLNVKGTRQGVPVDVDMFLDHTGRLVAPSNDQPQMAIKNKDEVAEAERKNKDDKYAKKVADLQKQLADAQALHRKMAAAAPAQAAAMASPSSAQGKAPGAVVPPPAPSNADE